MRIAILLCLSSTSNYNLQKILEDIIPSADQFLHSGTKKVVKRWDGVEGEEINTLSIPLNKNLQNAPSPKRFYKKLVILVFSRAGH